MMTSDGPSHRSLSDRLRRLTTPRGLLAALLVTAAGAHFMPDRIVDPLRGAWSALLRPAQIVTTSAMDFTHDRWTRVQAGWADGEHMAECQQEIDELREQNRRLTATVSAARVGEADSAERGSTGAPTEPLLHAEAVDVRVLGQTAQTFLSGQEVLDFGSRAGATRGALVIDGGPKLDSATDRTNPLLDAGADLGLRSGRVVLSGRRVWGKLATVGPHTSVVQRITDRGYRDAVQIVRHGDGVGAGGRLGPRGVLVGNGEAICRIELVETSEPVSVGDEVSTVADGVIPAPLVYGRITRVERPVAGAHWQIWMGPAIGGNVPRQVAVLKLELNAARIADSGTTDSRKE
jgi:rod shape-determining protein MreC